MTSIATTSQPACSASDASSGPDASSASRRETEVEMVRIAVRMARPAYLAHGTNSSSSDYLRVRVVGATTTTVFEERGAPDNDNGAWASASADLSAFAGQRVRIVVESGDAGTASLVEAAVDDVRVTRG